MKKIILFTCGIILSFGLMAQNCLQTIPAGPNVIKVDGNDVGTGGSFWICENITYEIEGDNNLAWIETGGEITISGDMNEVYMKGGNLTIDGSDGTFLLDSSVVYVDNGTNNTIDFCGGIDPLTYDYQNVTSVMDCIDTATATGVYVPKKIQEITLYPNPVRNVLNVNVPSKTGPSTYRVYSVSGNVVLNGVIASSSEQLDMSGLERGLYFIEIQNQDGKVSKRISVE